MTASLTCTEKNGCDSQWRFSVHAGFPPAHLLPVTADRVGAAAAKRLAVSGSVGCADGLAVRRNVDEFHSLKVVLRGGVVQRVEPAGLGYRPGAMAAGGGEGGGSAPKLTSDVGQCTPPTVMGAG